jgi:hypothetical protein
MKIPFHSNQDYQYGYPSKEEQQVAAARKVPAERRKEKAKQDEGKRDEIAEKRRNKEEVEEGKERQQRGTTPGFLSYVPRVGFLKPVLRSPSQS